METLTRIIERMLKRDPSIKQGIEEARILAEWPLSVGPSIAKHTRAYQIKNKTLFIEVDHPIWKQELHANKRLALQKLNIRISTLIGPHACLDDLFLVSPQPKRNEQE
jgi:predicted nucleic acid-binding Zn ribbon protein